MHPKSFPYVVSPGLIVRGVAGVSVAVLATLMLHDSASAQLTAQQLIAPTVGEYTAEYRDVEVAIAAFKRGDFATANKTLEAVREKHKELAPAEAMMALLYLSVGRRADAEAALDRAVVNEPKDPEAYVIAADLALREGRRTYADLGYQRAHELISTYTKNPVRQRNLQMRIHAGLASLSEARGQFDVTVEHLNQWQVLDPKNPIVWGSLGRVEFQRKNFDAAREAFSKLSELDEDAPPPEIALGRLYADSGMHDEARQQMKIATDNRGDDVRTRLTVAEWALTAGLEQMAQENIDAALKLDKDSVGGQVLAARLARQTGNFQKSESILVSAVLQSPNSFSVTNELARLLAASADEKKRETALEYARRNFQNQRNRESAASRESIMTYAWCLFQNNRSKEAEAALNTLPSGSVISNENAYYAAKIYSEQGKREVALNALQAALSQNVAFPGRDEAKLLLESLRER